jgi:hypothetical protein
MVLITNNQVVAILALLLAACVNVLMSGLGVPHKIVVGATILTVIAVAIFWSVTNLGPYDDDEE